MKFLRRFFIVPAMVTAVVAADHNGIVTYRGLPVPGAVVTASKRWFRV